MHADTVYGMWESYQERVSLDRIEQDHRSMVYAIAANGMAEKDAVEKVMEQMADDMLEARIRVIEGTAGERPEDTGVSEDGFVTEVWWGKKDEEDE